MLGCASAKAKDQAHNSAVSSYCQKWMRLDILAMTHQRDEMLGGAEVGRLDGDEDAHLRGDLQHGGYRGWTI